MTIHQDARAIVGAAIEAVLPGVALKNALTEISGDRPVYMVAIGKAAWKMAEAACEALGNRLKVGVVVTKYGHAKARWSGSRSSRQAIRCPTSTVCAARRGRWRWSAGWARGIGCCFWRPAAARHCLRCPLTA